MLVYKSGNRMKFGYMTCSSSDNPIESTSKEDVTFFQVKRTNFCDKSSLALKEVRKINRNGCRDY